jgi:hypothetical protein
MRIYYITAYNVIIKSKGINLNRLASLEKYLLLVSESYFVTYKQD